MLAQIPDEQATFELLATSSLPERDDIELARLYEGWDGVIPDDVPLSEPLEVGVVQELYVLNHDSITLETITAELVGVI